jgi:hypothetical protein
MEMIEEAPQGELNAIKILMEAAARPDEDHKDDIQEAMREMKQYTKAYEDRQGISHRKPQPPLYMRFNWPAGTSPPDLPNGDAAVSALSPNPRFNNWGFTVDYEPSWTLVVRTVEGVKAIVKWASKEGKGIRVAGFRHTWSYVLGKR